MSAEPDHADAAAGSPPARALDDPRGTHAAATQDDPARVRKTKLKVMAATNDLIERYSYRDVTIDAVVRASGVSRSTIYRHWPSRQVLVLEAFNHKTDALIDTPDSGDALADLRTHLAKLAFSLDFGGAASVVSGLVGDALADEEFAGHFRATIVRTRRRAFADIIMRGQRRGQIRSDVDVACVVDALYGAFHHRLLVTQKPFDQRFVDGLAGFAVSGLQVPAGRAEA